MSVLGWITISICGIVWISGWISCIANTENTRKGVWKVLGAVLLFFLWPYVAWSMMRQMG